MLLLALAAALADPDLADYARVAPGRYTTAAQAAADPRYDIVEADVTRIWPDRDDGLWVYQEQAILNRPGLTPADAKAKPYFQRVGHIYRSADGGLIRDNHMLRDPARVAGRPDAIAPSDLLAAGCANRLTKVAAGFWTARIDACPSGYKGAATMTSATVQTDDVYANWDRGWTAAGVRVWGPADGGYIFRKKR